MSTITKGLLIAGTLLGLTALAWRRPPLKSPPIQAQSKERFPRVAGTNLHRDDIELPRDFGGDLNLVFILWVSMGRQILVGMLVNRMMGFP